MDFTAVFDPSHRVPRAYVQRRALQVDVALLLPRNLFIAGDWVIQWAEHERHARAADALLPSQVVEQACAAVVLTELDDDPTCMEWRLELRPMQFTEARASKLIAYGYLSHPHLQTPAQYRHFAQHVMSDQLAAVRFRRQF